jgi:hypothetical protein
VYVNAAQSAVEFARTFNIEAQQLINYNTMMQQDEDGMVGCMLKWIIHENVPSTQRIAMILPDQQI